MCKQILYLLLVFLFFNVAKSQEVYHHILNDDLYFFLDELAGEKIITVNSAVKPYSRKFIADCLQKAYRNKEILNKRQISMLEFYLKDFQKELPLSDTVKTEMDYLFFGRQEQKNKAICKRLDLFYYKDSLFTLSVNPVVGYYLISNDSATVYHRWNGAEGSAYIGSHFGLYASLRDNYENRPLALRETLNRHIGGMYKNSGRTEYEGIEYSEMRGGLTYSWKWGSFGLIKDHFAWGNNYNGANIFSGRTPSFAHIRLDIHPVKWIKLNYVHGWLISEVIDSTRSYIINNTQRDVFRDKRIAANLFTVTPFKNLDVSFGNSIIYSDLGTHPAYLIPVFFYKSVDHTYNSTSNYVGQNSQMFFDISSRQIKHLHLFGSVFIDEVYISKIFDKDDHSNFFSGKAGFCLSNLIPNVSIVTEYTVNNPFVYEHFIPTTTFESNGYNLGHYLRHNAREIYAAITWQPRHTLKFDLNFCYAEKGEDYEYSGTSDVRGRPLIDTIKWTKQVISAKVSYEFINDGRLFFGYTFSSYTGEDIEIYTPYYFQGELGTIELGLNFGF